MKSKESLVFLGMMGSGKSSIGLIISKKLDIERISIETGAGKFFEPAKKLFKKCDFKPCKPFAHYKEDINSLYFTKLISNDMKK